MIYFYRLALSGIMLVSAGFAAQPDVGQSTAPTTGFAVATYGGVIYVAGETSGHLGTTKSYGGHDAFVVAYDQNGNQLWINQFGTSEEDRALAVAVDSTGIYAAGLTYGAFPGFTLLGNDDAMIVKMDFNGNMLWIQQFGTPQLDRITGLTTDGTYVYAVGVTNGALPGQKNYGGDDAFVQQYTQSGQLVYTKQGGSTGDDRAYGCFYFSPDVYITGRTDGVLPGQTSIGGLDAFFGSMTPAGTIKWDHQFGTTADDRGWAVVADSTGEYITGRTEGVFPGQIAYGDDDAYIVKYDNKGNQIWVNQFGTVDFDRGTGIASDSTGVYTTGVTDGTLAGQVNFGSRDCYVNKYDVNGNPLWTVQFGSDDFDASWGVATDPTGVYAAGTASGQLPGQDVTAGGFLIKYDQNGNLLWTIEFAPPASSVKH